MNVKNFFGRMLMASVLCCGLMACGDDDPEVPPTPEPEPEPQIEALTLTVDGQQVKNGETKTITYNVDSFDLMPDNPGILVENGFAPKIELTSDEDRWVRCVLTDKTQTGKIQCCWGGQCAVTSAAHPSMMKENELVAGVPQNMEIEIITNEHSATAFNYTMTLSYEDEFEDVLFECTLVFAYQPNK
ncbi:MAG: hypothetical protein HUK02_09285 [Bacteroidaceae bacterium]|nr:hypothetical protein [Bacteroidaceae bacterium]